LLSHSLFSVTDGFAERSGRPKIVKAYRAVRGTAGKHTQAALPEVGDLALKCAV
jgi:hypothetical protein